jgi:hypothetical protein
MRRNHRRILIAAVLCFSLGAGGARIHAREGVRDYPHSEHCPVHTPGPALDGDPFTFKATGTKALLTFVTCDNRSLTGPDVSGFTTGSMDVGYRLSISIDDLMVIEKTAFNNPANRIPFEDAKTLFNYGNTCYTGSTTQAVESVFDKRRTFRKAVVPFRENFEGDSSGWLLGNASFGVEASDQGKSLLLARRERPAGTPGRSCSVASVKVGGLTAGKDYVVDYSWWVAGFDDLDTFLGDRGFPQTATPSPSLSFYVNDPSTGALLP